MTRLPLRAAAGNCLMVTAAAATNLQGRQPGAESGRVLPFARPARAIWQQDLPRFKAEKRRAWMNRYDYSVSYFLLVFLIQVKKTKKVSFL